MARRCLRFGLAAAFLMLSQCETPRPAASPGATPVTISIAAPPPLSTTAASPVETPAPAGEWPVGVFLSLSGPEAMFGVDTKEGMDLAVDDENQDGGPRHRRIKLIYTDDKSSPQEAANQVLSLIDRERVVAVLGEVASSRSRAGGVVANKRRVPMISPSSTNPDVTQVGPFVFRTCFTDLVQAKAAARFVVRFQGKKQIAMLFAADDLYSASLAKVFREEARKLGATIVAEQSFLRTETNFTPYLQQIRKQNPDLVYVPIYYTVMIPIARQAKALGFSGSDFVGSDGWDTAEILRGAGAELEGATFTNHWAVDAPWPRASAFVTAYRQRYQHDPTSLAATGYDAALVLADAMRRAGGDTPEAIRDALQATKSFPGATGSITIDHERNAAKNVLVNRITKGRFAYHTSIDMPETSGAPAAP